jgi:hypothetical protein
VEGGADGGGGGGGRGMVSIIDLVSVGGGGGGGGEPTTAWSSEGLDVMASVGVSGGERGGKGETGVKGEAMCAEDTERGGEEGGHVADARNRDVEIRTAHGARRRELESPPSPD